MNKVNQLREDEIEEQLRKFVEGEVDETEFFKELMSYHADITDANAALDMAKEEKSQYEDDNGQFGVGT